jgi:TPR repeat protein
MTDFDAAAKERELVAESESWDTSMPVDAEPGDIPIVDVAEYFATGSSDALAIAGDALRAASENVGFCYLKGHGIPRDLIAETFSQTERFHRLPHEIREGVLINRPGAEL